MFADLGIPWKTSRRSLTVAVLLAFLGGTSACTISTWAIAGAVMWCCLFFWTGIPMILGSIDAVRYVLLDEARFQALVRRTCLAGCLQAAVRSAMCLVVIPGPDRVRLRHVIEKEPGRTGEYPLLKALDHLEQRSRISDEIRKEVSKVRPTGGHLARWIDETPWGHVTKMPGHQNGRRDMGHDVMVVDEPNGTADEPLREGCREHLVADARRSKGTDAARRGIEVRS